MSWPVETREMQLQINCFATRIDDESSSDAEATHAIERAIGAMADALAAAGLGVVVEVRDLRRAMTTQHIVRPGLPLISM
ncbi:MAG TPA: hypothetical protein VD978_22180 [Azospirillum sp.]|nr:hypothetical protein [Azospirillum sp.]